MNEIHIRNLLYSMGVPQHHKGYAYLIHLIKLGAGYKNQSLPSIKELYAQTAEYFHTSCSNVEYNVRTVVRCYWMQKYSRQIFSSVTHYPVTQDLTVKTFILVLSEYAAKHLS